MDKTVQETECLAWTKLGPDTEFDLFDAEFVLAQAERALHQDDLAALLNRRGFRLAVTGIRTRPPWCSPA